MAYNRTQVRDLLNAGERDLFEASLADHIKTLTAMQLRSRIGRTRALHDKYRDRLRRQQSAIGDRIGSPLGLGRVGHQRTEQKAAVLGEVLQRFEKRARQLDAAQARAAEKTASAAARLQRVPPRPAEHRPPAAPKAVVNTKARSARSTAAKVLRGLLESGRAGAGVPARRRSRD